MSHDSTLQTEFFEDAGYSQDDVPLDTLFDESFVRTESARGVTIQPTVLIGVGGSGIRCLRRAKLQIRQRLGMDLTTTRFVYIDADANSYTQAAGLADVDFGERCQIGGISMEPVVRNPKLHQWIYDQFSSPIPKSFLRPPVLGQGCGAIRAVGRMTLLASMNTVETQIKQAIDQVLQVEAHNEVDAIAGMAGGNVVNHPVIYIVGSLAGGTGSGTYLDAALKARALATEAKIIGLFVLPEAFEETAQGDRDIYRLNRANAYAALMEIQALQENECNGLRVKDSETTTVELPPTTRLFDLCYFVDRKNDFGQRLSSLQDVYEMVSRNIVHSLATVAGAHARTVEVNTAAVQGVARCPEANQVRNLSTFAASRLKFPAEAISRHCTWMMMRECIGSALLNGVGADVAESQAQKFLTVRELDEMERVDQVLLKLLVDPQTRKQVSATYFGVTGSFAKSVSNNDYVVQALQKLNSLQETAGKVSKFVDENSAHYLGTPTQSETPLAVWLDSALEAWLDEFGALGALEITNLLRSRVAVFSEQMAQENAEWQQQARKAKLDQLQNRIKDLKELGFLKAKLTKKDEELRGTITESLIAIVEGDIRVPARTAAVKIFESFGRLLAQRSSQLQALIVTCRQVDGALVNKIEVQRNQRKANSQRIVSGIDVVDPDFPQQYYENVKVRDRAQESLVTPKSFLDKVRASLATRFPHPLLKLLDANAETLHQLLYQQIAGHYWNPLRQTNIVEFLNKRKEGGKSKLAGFLEQLAALCQPFWYTAPPNVGVQYNHVLSLSCNYLKRGAKDEAGPVLVPSAIQSWVKSYSKPTREGSVSIPIVIESPLPYEIELVRYTHGARAFYFRDAATWKGHYKETLAGGGFPLHLHKDLAKVSDLYPDRNTEDRVYFALAVAFGFIAKRGNNYYRNLKERNDGKLEVPMNTQAMTVFGSPESRKVPGGDPGGIVFQFDKNKRPEKANTAWVGRESAAEQFCSNNYPEFVGLVRRAVDAYSQDRGNAALKVELSAYAKALLEEANQAKNLQEAISEEANLVEKFIAGLE